MLTVVIESPYGPPKDLPDGERARILARNERYLVRCIRDCLARGEAPYASHWFFTRPGLLRDDDDPEERRLGMTAGFAIGGRLEKVVVYTDYGITPGMREGIARAEAAGLPVETRSIGKNEDQPESNPHAYVDGVDGCAVCGEGLLHYLHEESDAPHAAAPAAVAPAAGNGSPPPFPAAKREALRAFARAYVEQVLAGSVNLSDAARRAGLDRSNFRRLMKQAGIANPWNGRVPGTRDATD